MTSLEKFLFCLKALSVSIPKSTFVETSIKTKESWEKLKDGYVNNFNACNGACSLEAIVSEGFRDGTVGLVAWSFNSKADANKFLDLCVKMEAEIRVSQINTNLKFSSKSNEANKKVKKAKKEKGS